MQKSEFRVRPVVRYIVTKFTPGYTAPDGSCGHSSRSEVIGEFPSEEIAYSVADSMETAQGLNQGIFFPMPERDVALEADVMRALSP